MAIRPNRVIFTYQDLLQFPEDGKRYEILEGELVVTPAPHLGHQGAATALAAVLYNHVDQHGLGKVLAAPCDVLLSEISVVEPDLLFVSRERRQIMERAFIRGAPDLVVEILSPSTARRDREAKMKLYAQYGVPNYWLIDPDAREAVAYVLQQGEYRQAVLAQNDEPFSAPPFPDLAIPLGQLWS
jgi:Uma2 family endonuclease